MKLEYRTGHVMQADGVTGGECGGLQPFMKLEYLTSLVLQADGVTGGECGRLHPFTKLEYRTGLVLQADGVTGGERGELQSGIDGWLVLHSLPLLLRQCFTLTCCPRSDCSGNSGILIIELPNFIKPGNIWKELPLSRPFFRLEIIFNSVNAFSYNV
jgi:hypothetical protein